LSGLCVISFYTFPICDRPAALNSVFYRSELYVYESLLVLGSALTVTDVERTLPGGIDWTALTQRERRDDPARVYRILVVDLVGLLPDSTGQADATAFATHLELRGATFHDVRDSSINELLTQLGGVTTPGLHFFYQPLVAREVELLTLAAESWFDGLIAAATNIPAQALFSEGAVRIGAGTGNMGSVSWGGGDGLGGGAPLMNTPSFNARATAQMVFKALLRVRPDLDVDELYDRVRDLTFDTGEHLREFSTRKLEGQRIGVLGFGNIGREVAKLAAAFGMEVAVFARASQRRWIESEGFEYCASVFEAAYAADVLSLHLGLGPGTVDGFANFHAVNAQVLAVMAEGGVLINYDRGELVDVAALNAAMCSGHIGFAAIDADLFLGESGPTGPLASYLELLSQHAQSLQLLPHAAADTDHPSRCSGALQAADQLIAAICYRCVANLKGDLPQGYSQLGPATVPTVGPVTTRTIAAVADNAPQLNILRRDVRALAQWLDKLSVETAAREGEQAQSGVEAANRVHSLLASVGLLGSARDL